MGAVPPGLASLFNDPPLVGDEKREDYENLFSAIVAAIKPNDAVVWLLARDFADLQWEIRRERKLKLKIIKLAQLEWTSKLLSPARPSLLEMPHMPPTTEQLAKLWSADAETLQSIDDKLAKKGFNASFVMTLASKRAAPQIEAIDRRIGTYEMRRMAVMKAIEQYSEASARRLAASSDVIDGEFTEAEE
jgi:hypothetical protein